MKSVNYYPLKLLTKNFIIIDGISRTGKLLLGSLICSFDKMEHLEFGENFEHFLPAVKFKKIDLKFAKSFIHNHLNQIIYNKYLSRNVNFRPSDRTGIDQSVKPQIYYKRLKAIEGDEIIKKIKKEKPLIPIVTHDLSINFDILEKMKINFKIIEIFRSPIDMVYSWYKKGLGKRYGLDQRIFTLLINDNKNICPWYDALIKKKTVHENEVERCITLVLILIKHSVLSIKKNRKKMFITTYEEVTQNTKFEIKKIAKFLNTKINSSTYKFMLRENCPIHFDKNKFEKRKLFIQDRCSKKKFQEILNIQRLYEKNLYGLR